MMNGMKRAALAAIVAAMVTGSAVAREAGPTSQKLKDATLRTVSGKKVSLAKATKDRVCIVKFGATWCGPCTMMLMELNKIIKHYGDKVLVIDIDIREAPKTVVEHYRKHGFKAKLLLDIDGSVSKAFGVGGIPHTLIVGRDGTIATTLVGARPATALKPILDKLLAEGSEAEPTEEAAEEK